MHLKLFIAHIKTFILELALEQGYGAGGSRGLSSQPPHATETVNTMVSLVFYPLPDQLFPFLLLPCSPPSFPYQPMERLFLKQAWGPFIDSVAHRRVHVRKGWQLCPAQPRDKSGTVSVVGAAESENREK